MESVTVSFTASTVRTHLLWLYSSVTENRMLIELRLVVLGVQVGAFLGKLKPIKSASWLSTLC